MYKCQICGKEYKLSSHLSQHISRIHNIDKKEYYDIYLKKEGENICPVCGDKTFYSGNWQRGYSKYCSGECKSIGVKNKMEKTCLEKYGVKNANKSEKVRNRIKQTNIEKFGNSCPMQNEEIQKNIRKKNNENLGVDLPFQSSKIQERVRETMKERYGGNTMNSPILSEKVRKTMRKKYGVEYSFQSKELLNKSKKTKLERYGDENYLNREQIKNTKLKRYGDENYLDREKAKKTMERKYGGEYTLLSNELKNKVKKTKLERYGDENYLNREQIKKTMIERYGVEFPLQNEEIFQRSLKTSHSIKYFRNTDLYYQGSFELDFLEKYYDKLKIERGPTLKYQLDESNKIYYPDFYLPDFNLIIECKNSYLAKKDRDILEIKKKVVLKSGFNFMMIIDKNYTKFETLYQ